ncbi:fibronectin type III domain-containing protein [Myxococcus stipitatus DSM 14675]|uniref:Fibronectin type III domain-containing protein n=1 Tax=Myxococcus stipitatus (strain DSM 14675 / JCM 12634 / Mx s8) TaxID=1278073 RepID=L7U818_MYXSD|nr:MXAN_2561 family MXYO-CTERM-anchored protein [Myxococcus stipitatus]AGC44268.1 fibronectin type III domain-containing protein [Myxococcus stipitatus DSM 14675]
MRHIFVVLLLTASTALGQSVTFTGAAIQDGEISVSLDDCAKKIPVTWTKTGTLLCGDLTLFLTKGSCSAEDPGASGNKVLKTIKQSDSITTEAIELQMSVVLAEGGLTCAAQTANVVYKLCASTKVQTISTGLCPDKPSSVGKPDVNFILDPIAPEAPPAPAVTGLDSALSVSVAPTSDTTRLKVEVVEMTQGDDGGVATPGEVVRSKEQVTPNNVFRMDGLENGKTYGVRAIAFDKAGNQGKASELATGAPIASNGFFDEYVDAGGQETGGCGAGGGGLAVGAAMAALGFWLTSRRKQS